MRGTFFLLQSKFILCFPLSLCQLKKFLLFSLVFLSFCSSEEEEEEVEV